MPTPVNTPSKKKERPHSVALSSFTPTKDGLFFDLNENKLNSPNVLPSDFSKLTPKTKQSSTKKWLAAEITRLAAHYNQIEKERSELVSTNEHIKKDIELVNEKRKRKLGKMKCEYEALKYTNKEISKKNEKLKEELNKVKKELDSFVTSNWKSHMYRTLNEDWFNEYLNDLDA